MAAGCNKGALVDYNAIVAGRTLEEIARTGLGDHFSDLLWVLNETEHGSNSPERLYAFDELLRHPDRTPEADKDLFIPFLLRYLWEVPYPDYTRIAWRTLQKIVSDPEDLADIAFHLLSTHPHGALRTEVVACDEEARVPGYFSEPRFVGLMIALLVEDPTPQVRASLVQTLVLEGWAEDHDWSQHKAGTLDRLLAARLADDPAAEVRQVIFYWLASERRQIPALLKALKDKRNDPILPQIIASFSSHIADLTNDADAAAVLMTTIAAAQAHAQFGDIVRRLDGYMYQIGQAEHPATRHLLQAAPFADGAALLAFYRNTFQDATLSPLLRAFGLRGLDKHKAALQDHDIVEFMLKSSQTIASLDMISGSYNWFNGLYTRAFPQNPTPVTKLHLMHDLTRHLPQSEGLSGLGFRNRVINLAFRHAVAVADQALLDAAFDLVRMETGWIGTAMSSLGATEAGLDLTGLMHVAEGAVNIDNASYASNEIAGRFKKLRDGQSLAWLERLFTQHVQFPLLGDLVRELPARRDLAPADHDRLTAAVAVAAGRPVENQNDVWMHARLVDWLA